MTDSVLVELVKLVYQALRERLQAIRAHGVDHYLGAVYQYHIEVCRQDCIASLDAALQPSHLEGQNQRVE